MRDLDFLESPLLKAAETLKQKKAHVQEWKHILKRLPGVKQVEIDWLGLHDWLDGHPKTQKAKPEAITKEELVTFIRANQVKLQVFVRANTMPPTAGALPSHQEWDDARVDEAVEFLLEHDGSWGEPDYKILDQEAPVYPDDYSDEAEQYLEEAEDELSYELDEDGAEPTKDEIFQRAKEIAEKRFEPYEFEVTLGAVGTNWPTYKGYYHNLNNSFYFPNLPTNGILKENDPPTSAETPEGERFEQSPDVAREAALYLAKQVWETSLRNAAKSLLAGWQKMGIDALPEHSGYTQPGGKDYHEFEIIFPNLHVHGKNKIEDLDVVELARMRQELEGHYKSPMSEYPGGEDAWCSRHEVLRDAVRQQEYLNRDSKEPFVESAHFEEENIVVHVRANTRKGPNGEKILFAEEFQSDLATKWREDTEPAEVTALRRQLEKEKEELSDQLKGALTDVIGAIKMQDGQYPEGLWTKNSPHPWMYIELKEQDTLWLEENVSQVLAVENNQFLLSSPEKRAEWLFEGHKNATTPDAVFSLIMKSDEAVEAARRYYEIKSLSGKKSAELLSLGTEKKISPRLPDTPFKEEHSYNLAVKFLLRWAAEKGFDGVAWTPAWMQAERWREGATSVVHGISWAPIEEESARGEFPPSKLLKFRTSQGGSIDMTIGNDGTVIRSDRENHRFSEKHISQLLPAKIADRILNENSGSWSEQKLTMQDSGYVVAYDIQARKAMDRFVRKFGSRVDAISGIEGLEGESRVSRDAILSKPVEDVEVSLIGAGLLTPDEAERMLETARGLSKDSSLGLPSGLEQRVLIGKFEDEQLARAFPKAFQADPVWYVGMTPELKKACLEPMPMFRMPGIGQKGHLPQNALDRVTGELEGRLKKLGLEDVDLLADASFSQQGAVISQGFDEFTVLIGRTLDPHQTLDHEAVHILRRRGLFTVEEWQALSQAAEDEWIDDYNIEARYGGAPRSVQIEEAIAEAFADHAAKLRNQPIIKRAFNKVRAFFRELSRSLSACGISNVEQIFDAADAGLVGRRKSMGTERAFSMNPTPLAAGPGI